MPRVAQYQAVQFRGFEDGLNLHADSSRLEMGELAESINFRLGSRGEMRLRNGYTRYDSNLGDTAMFVHPWRAFDSTDHLIVVLDNKSILHDSLNGTFINSGFNVGGIDSLPGFGVGFAGADKFAYLSSKKIGDVVKFDGSSWSSVPSIPKAKHLLFRHDRLFAINTDTSPSRLFFSEFIDPEDFQVESWIDFDPDDGYEINAATVFGDDLILFKDNAIWKLSGRTPASFATYRIDNQRGCVSPRTVDQLRGLLIFLDRDTGIWAFNGAAFELLSESINDYLLAGMDHDAAWDASAYVGEDRYYLSVPWDGGGRRSFIYFADTGGWTEYDTGFEGALFYLRERYLGFPGADGLYRADPLSQLVPPSGAPLTGRFRTPWVRVGGPGMKARIRRIEMTVKADAGVDATIRMYRDFDEETVYLTKTFTGGSVPYQSPVSKEERVITLDGWGDRLHAVQFEIETNEAPFQLNDMTVFFTGGVDIRGER